MIFRMDTDSVRAMAARFRRTASTMETSLASIRQSVRSAPWQSQAREEFIQQLEMLHNSTLRSAEVLRMMALAAEQKANQWEAIGDRFNGPWQAMGNAWGQLKSMMGWLWSRIRNAVRGIKWPSVPKYLYPGVIIGPIIGGIRDIVPSWKFTPPPWWPFNQKPNTESSITSDGSKTGTVPSQDAITFPIIDYDDKNWSEKFALYDEFSKELADINNGKISGSDERIDYLKVEIEKLSSIINKGIPADGPTTGIKLAGCTKYVSEQRDVSDFLVAGQSNANNWKKLANDKKWEIGDRPIPGSIMVLQKDNGFMSGLTDAGHVVFIESVTRVDGGYQITYSHASTPRGSDGKWTGEYYYTNQRTDTKTLYDGTSGIDFIYEESKG